MLEKLYQVLYDKKLFTQDYVKFKNSWQDDEYKKKVFDVVSSKKLFTKDYESFVNIYKEGKQQDGVAMGAKTSSQKDTASNSEDYSSEWIIDPKTQRIVEKKTPIDKTNKFQLGHTLTKDSPNSFEDKPVDRNYRVAAIDVKFESGAGMVYGDPRTYNQQVKDYVETMDKLLSAKGDFSPLIDKSIEYRYNIAKKFVKTPVGSPSDISSSYYEYWKQINVHNFKDSKRILEPLFLDKRSLKEDYMSRKTKNLKNFATRIKEGLTEDDLISEADKIIGDMIHESDYMSKEFLPYFFSKNKDLFLAKQIEILEGMEGDFLSNADLLVINEKMNKFQLNLLEEEIKKDKGYHELITSITQTVGEDLNVDIRKFNKSKVLPDWIEGSDILEGIFKTIKGFQSGAVNTELIHRSKDNRNIKNFLNAIKSGDLNEKELIELAKNTLLEVDIAKLYPKSSASMRILQGYYSLPDDQRKQILEGVDPIPYLENKIKNHNKFFISQISKSQELTKEIEMLDSAQLFDEDGITFKDFKLMTGEQLTQMLAAIVTFGGSTYIQEASGVYIESLYRTAEDKYGDSWKNASDLKKQEILYDLIESGEDDPNTAIRVGITNAALDFGSNLFVVTKAARVIPRQAWRSLLRGEIKKAMDKAGAKNMSIDALKISSAESITEGLQEVNSMAGANRSTGIYKFDINRVKEGAGQGFLSSLLFFGLGKGRSGINFGLEEIVLKTRWGSKSHILSMIKAERAKVKKALKEGEITLEEANQQNSNINDAKDVLIDEGVYKIKGKEEQQRAIEKANKYNKSKKNTERKAQDLKEAKSNNNASEEDIKYREEQLEVAIKELSDSKYELQKEQVIDFEKRNRGKAASRVNESNEGPMADKRIFTFRTRKEAAAFVKRYNIPVDRQVKQLLDGKISGVALGVGNYIKYKGSNITPAMIVGQTIKENILKSDRNSDGNLISAFAESHEVTHFILDSMDPKALANMVGKLKSSLKKSADPKTALMVEFIELQQAGYKREGADQQTLNQEWLTAMGDYIKSQEALDVKSPVNDALSDFGKLINSSIFKAVGYKVDFTTPSSVWSLLKNWDKFVTSKGSVKIKGSVDVDELTGRTKSAAQATLEQRKQSLISEQKALLSLRDDPAIAKQMKENIVKIKELNKAIEVERDLLDQGKFPAGISKKAKDITRANRLIVDEAYDPQTSPEVKAKKFEELFDLNRGLIERTVNRQFNPNIQSKLTIEDLRQAYNLEFFKILENNYDPSKGPLGAYISKFLPLRQGNILRELIGHKSMMFTDDSSSTVGNKQVGYSPDYGNFSNEEYVQQMVKTMETLGFTPELKDIVKTAVMKIIGGKLNITSKSFKVQLSRDLMVQLKSEIQTKVLGSRIKNNFLGMRYPDFMAKYWEDIYAIMPIDAINSRFSIQTKQEKANNIPNPFIFKFTKESGKQLRDSRKEDGTGVGRAKTKKRAVNQQEFLDFFFGANVGKSTQGTRKDTLAEMIAEQAGFDVFSYLLTNDPSVTEFFRGRQELLGEIITEDTIDRLQREINRYDGSRDTSSRAQIVIDSANYNGITVENINVIFEDIKSGEIINYGSKQLNMFRNDVLDALRLDDVAIDMELYHTTYSATITEDVQIRGFNFIMGDLRAVENTSKTDERSKRFKTYHNKFKTKLNLNRGIIIPDIIANDIEERHGAIDISLSLMNQTSWFRKPSSATLYIGKYLQEEGYITQQELESNGSSEALRNLLVSKGYSYFSFLDMVNDAEKIILLDKEAISRKSEIAMDSKIYDLLNPPPPSRAQLSSLSNTLGKIIEQKTKGKIASKDKITAAGAKVMSKNRSIISKLSDTFNYIPYNAEDFIGLTRVFVPSGKDGDAAIRFIGKKLLEPYYQGQKQFRTWKQNLNIQYNRLFDRSDHVASIDKNGMPSLSKKTLDGDITIRTKRVKTAKVKQLVEEKAITKAEGDNMISEIKKFKFKKKSLQSPVIIKGKTFTAEQAVRTYIFYTAGEEIDVSLMSEEELKGLVDFIKDPNNIEFLLFASSLRSLIGRTRSEGKGDYYIKYNDKIINNTVSHDIYNHAESERKVFFEKFKNNFENIFTKKNLLKLESLYGTSFIKELNGSFKRMYTGKNEPLKPINDLESGIMGWTNASVNSIMFLNLKSAALQLISFVNFINWSDNNLVAAGKAMANPKQFVKDFSMLYNSRYLTNRRGGLKFDIESNAVEKILLDSMYGEKNSMAAFRKFYAQLVKFGYIPTRMADSFAIAFGGASFYRNRLNTYLKDMTKQKAIEKTMIDFERLAEESQQSSDPSRISSIQIGPWGRLIFAFMNTPFQYARLSKRAFLDLVNGRGDVKTNISKLTYYAFVQSMFFSAAQNLLNVFDLIPLFKDDDEEEELTPEEKTSYFYSVNSWLESQMKMFGIPGVAGIAFKNIELSKYRDKLWRDQEEGGFITPKRSEQNQMIRDIFSVSPPISSKFQQASSIEKLQKWNINKERSDYYGLGDFWYLYPQDPAWEIAARRANLIANIPLDRLHRKLENISLALDNETKLYTDILLIFGYSKYTHLPKEKWDLAYPETKSRDFKKFLKIREREERRNKKRDKFTSRKEYLKFLRNKRK